MRVSARGCPLISRVCAQEEVIASAVTTPLCLQSMVVVGNEWNGPLWQVSAFAFCYAIFPLLLARFHANTAAELRRTAVWWCLGGAIVGVLGWLVSRRAAHVFFALRVPQFVVGMCAGLWARRTKLERPTRLAELCTLLLATAFVAGPLTMVKSGAADNVSSAYVLFEFLVTPVHALWLLALMSPDCQGPTNWFFSSAPLQALGAISYSTYCLHWPTLFWSAWAVAGQGVSASAVPRRRLPDSEAGWFFFQPQAAPALVAVCLGIGALVYHGVEKPARALIIRWLELEP
jgi:peptidoglycan/LPS O-acetylase OafA/YrhL